MPGIGIADEVRALKFFEELFNKIVLVQHKLPICQNFLGIQEKDDVPKP